MRKIIILSLRNFNLMIFHHYSFTLLIDIAATVSMYVVDVFGNMSYLLVIYRATGIIFPNLLARPSTFSSACWCKTLLHFQGYLLFKAPESMAMSATIILFGGRGGLYI